MSPLFAEETMENDDTTRTKNAIRKWAGISEGGRLLLDDELDSLRPSEFRNVLRVRLNEEFRNDQGFPISVNEWNSTQSSLKTVRDVRDFVRKRRGT